MTRDLRELSQRLGFGLADLRPDLLTLAFTPPSLNLAVNNDRLEFLGDEVLRLVAAEFVYSRYPKRAVGDLTSLRSQLVKNQTLALWAKDLGLAEFLPPGATEAQLADAFEALVGAIYLSAPPENPLAKIRNWLQPFFLPVVEQALSDPTYDNHKSALQEWSQHYLKELPEYLLLAEEPDFSYSVWLKGRERGRGSGTSKKQAQQNAARAAYGALPLTEILKTLTPAQEQALQAYL